MNVSIIKSLLTTGLIPFIIEGQNEIFWFSLAIGTIGGLIFSMVGVFWVLPVLLWKKTIIEKIAPAKVQRRRKGFFRVFSRRRSDTALDNG